MGGDCVLLPGLGLVQCACNMQVVWKCMQCAFKCRVKIPAPPSCSTPTLTPPPPPACVQCTPEASEVVEAIETSELVLC